MNLKYSFDVSDYLDIVCVYYVKWYVLKSFEWYCDIY